MNIKQNGPIGILTIVFIAALVGTIWYLTVRSQAPTQELVNGPPDPAILPPTPPIPPYQPPKLLTQAPEEPREPVTEADFNLQTPNGGEVFSANQSLLITYSISKSFRDKLKASDLTELYLLDTKNVLVGYVGEVDVTANEFLWDPRELMHNAGLTFVTSPPSAGQYRILLLGRHPNEPHCTNCDLPVDTLDGTTFENGYLVDSETAKRYDASYRGFRPLATDVSASLFTLK